MRQRNNQGWLGVDALSSQEVNAQTMPNWLDRNELPAVRVGARRAGVRQSE
jgi:hypothetical protein